MGAKTWLGVIFLPPFFCHDSSNPEGVLGCATFWLQVFGRRRAVKLNNLGIDHSFTADLELERDGFQAVADFVEHSLFVRLVFRNEGDTKAQVSSGVIPRHRGDQLL